MTSRPARSATSSSMGLEKFFNVVRGVVKLNHCGYCLVEIDADALFCSKEHAELWYESLEESNYDYGE